MAPASFGRAIVVGCIQCADYNFSPARAAGEEASWERLGCLFAAKQRYYAGVTRPLCPMPDVDLDGSARHLAHPARFRGIARIAPPVSKRRAAGYFIAGILPCARRRSTPGWKALPTPVGSFRRGPIDFSITRPGITARSGFGDSSAKASPATT